jgi:predicted dienelactone hydrolase
MAVRVYAPAAGGPYPVVVFCAGSGGGNDTFAPTSTYLASHGYAVLHTSYPFNQRKGVGNDELTENRVADIKLALDALGRIEGPKPELKGKFDPKAVGAMGHSSGAYITQLVGGARPVFGGQEQDFRDDRVKAVIQYSGQGSGQQGLTKESWKKLTIPMLTMTGTKDRGATGGGPEWKKEPFDLSAAGDKYHACYDGGHHGSFSGRFGQKELFAHVQVTTLAFWDAYLRDDKEAKAFLRSDAPQQVGGVKLEYARR